MAEAAFESGKGQLDQFGHPKLKQAGLIIAAVLKTHLARAGIEISHAGKIDYLFRSANTSPTDIKMCNALGKAAVKYIIERKHNLLLYVDNEGNVKDIPLTQDLGGRTVDIKGKDKDEYFKANQALLRHTPRSGGKIYSPKLKEHTLSPIKCIGILTGGGPASGHNEVIASVLETANAQGIEVIGIPWGWNGLIVEEYIAQAKPLSLEEVLAHRHEGGTILGTSRTNPYKKEGDPQKSIGSK